MLNGLISGLKQKEYRRKRDEDRKKEEEAEKRSRETRLKDIASSRSSEGSEHDPIVPASPRGVLESPRSNDSALSTPRMC